MSGALSEELVELVAPSVDVAAEPADLLSFALVESVADGVSLGDIAQILDWRERRVSRRPMEAKELE